MPISKAREAAIMNFAAARDHRAALNSPGRALQVAPDEAAAALAAARSGAKRKRAPDAVSVKQQRRRLTLRPAPVARPSLPKVQRVTAEQTAEVIEAASFAAAAAADAAEDRLEAKAHAAAAAAGGVFVTGEVAALAKGMRARPDLCPLQPDGTMRVTPTDRVALQGLLARRTRARPWQQLHLDIPLALHALRLLDEGRLPEDFDYTPPAPALC